MPKLKTPTLAEDLAFVRRATLRDCCCKDCEAHVIRLEAALADLPHLEFAAEQYAGFLSVDHDGPTNTEERAWLDRERARKGGE